MYIEVQGDRPLNVGHCRMKKPRTLLEEAFEQAMRRSGRPPSWYGRKLAEPGATPKQVQNALSTLRRHLRQGNASFGYAARVVTLLEIDASSRLHDLLLKPRKSWPGWATPAVDAGKTFQPKKATGTPGKSRSVASRDRACVAARPVSPIYPSGSEHHSGDPVTLHLIR